MKFRRILYVITIYVFSTLETFSQTTDKLVVKGLVKDSLTLNLSDISLLNKTKIDGIKITNHLGEFRREYRNLQGVAIADLLQNINISEKLPKLLSEYYFVFKAIDGYSVVFSWNEIFNTDIGKQTFIITNIDGKNASELDERILLISTKDYRTGRRHIKALSTIEVKKI